MWNIATLAATDEPVGRQQSIRGMLHIVATLWGDYRAIPFIHLINLEFLSADVSLVSAVHFATGDV